MFAASSTDWTVANLTPGIPHLTVCTPWALVAQVHSPLPLAQPRILGSVGMHVFFLCSKHAFSFLCCWICYYPARLPRASRVLEDSRFRLRLQHAHWVLLGRKWICNLYDLNDKLYRAVDPRQVAGACVWTEDGYGCWSRSFFSSLNSGWVEACSSVTQSRAKEMSEKSMHVFDLAAVCNCHPFKKVFFWGLGATPQHCYCLNPPTADLKIHIFLSDCLIHALWVGVWMCMRALCTCSYPVIVKGSVTRSHMTFKEIK